MPSRRMIDPAFWQSESMAELTHEQRLCFIGLISNADDQGRLKAPPALLRSILYPYDDYVTIEMMESHLEAIAAIKSIFVYENGGKRFIQIVNWWKYQSPQWAYPSKIPPPDGWKDKLRYRKGGKIIKENWGGEDGTGFGGDSGDDYPNLPKSLPKAKGKDLGGPVVLALEIDKDSTTTAHTCAILDQIGLLCKANFADPTKEPFHTTLKEDIQTYSADWVIQAINLALSPARANGQPKNWAYVEGILKSWQACGGPENDKKGQKQNGRTQTAYQNNGRRHSKPSLTERPAHRTGGNADEIARFVATVARTGGGRA